MKSIVGSLLALSLVGGLVGHADAANPQQKKRLKAGQYGKSYPAKARAYRNPALSDSSSDYYEHLRDKVPFGSKQWWSVYEEQHGTPY